MSSAEDKLAAKLPAIQTALEQAILDAAGERMGFVLLVVPLNRIGDHIAISNIAERGTIIRFIREVAHTMKTNWARAEIYAAEMAKRAVN